jgi:hypothetical protein
MLLQEGELEERRCPICRDNWKARVRNERQEVIPVIHASFCAPEANLGNVNKRLKSTLVLLVDMLPPLVYAVNYFRKRLLFK